MSLAGRVNNLVDEFESYQNWEERYAHIISLGKSLAPMPNEFKVDQNKVKGCQSQVWIFAELVDQKVQFYADSDASIVKGVIAVLMKVYNDATPDDILACRPEFLDRIGLREQLSMSRANGLSAMLKQLSIYALAFKAKMNSERS